MYDPSSIYVVGNSKTNTENAITTLYNSFYIGFVLDPSSVITSYSIHYTKLYEAPVAMDMKRAVSLGLIAKAVRVQTRKCKPKGEDLENEDF